MAIALRGTPQVGSAANGGDVTLTFDVALQQGDVVIVYGGTVRTLAGNPEGGPSTEGYTEIAYNSLINYNSFGAWYKVMGASPDATVVCRGSLASAGATAYGCYALSGVHAAVQDQTVTQVGPITNGVPDCGSITTQTDNAWVIAVASQASGSFDATPGTISGYENQYTTYADDLYDYTIAGATLLKASAGAEDPAAWSSWATSASQRYYAYTIAVKPAGAAGNARQVKVNGAWKTISSPMVKVNGVWRAASSLMVKTPVGWKTT